MTYKESMSLLADVRKQMMLSKQKQKQVIDFCFLYQKPLPAMDLVLLRMLLKELSE